MTHIIPDLSGKTALVTGASRGIGRACAIALARAGAHILALARTVGALEALDDDIRAAGGTASLIPADLTDTKAIATLGPTLATRFDKLDILVGCGAILGELAPLQDVDEKIWQSVIETNLTANWRLLASLNPLLATAPAARVVFITSRVGGEAAQAFWGPYAVSKAGLEMLAKTYAEETRNGTTRVAIIDPGAMRTAMRAQAMPGEDPQTLPSPEDIIPLLYHSVSPHYDGIAERLVRRNWSDIE